MIERLSDMGILLVLSMDHRWWKTSRSKIDADILYTYTYRAAVKVPGKRQRRQIDPVAILAIRSVHSQAPLQRLEKVTWANIKPLCIRRVVEYGGPPATQYFPQRGNDS
jgi:hypothetical protein